MEPLGIGRVLNAANPLNPRTPEVAAKLDLATPYVFGKSVPQGMNRPDW